MNEVGFYPSRRLKKRNGEYFAYVNVWPFVGVMIVLLVSMMVGVGPRNICIKEPVAVLPVVSHAISLPWAEREDAMRVLVMPDGSVFFGNTKIVPGELPGQIREQVRSGSERRIYFRVDVRARYGDVKQVLDGVRDVGIEKVSFLVEGQRTY